MTISRDSGSPLLTYGLAAAAPISYTIGLVAWTVKSAVHFKAEECDHAVYDQTHAIVPLCASTGYWIALSALVAVLIMSIVTVAAVYLRDDILDSGLRLSEDDRVCGIGTKFCSWGIILLIFVSLALTIGALLSPRWVLDEGSTDHYGSLFTWDVIEGYNNLGYQCLAGPSCESSASSVICKTLGDLH